MNKMLLIFLMSFAAVADASNIVYRKIDSERVSIVRYEGKPPFERKVVRLKDLSPGQLRELERQARERVSY
jgi:hypothetical protein